MSGKRKSLFQQMVDSTLAPFWGTMSRNWLLKLICVGLAFAVWQGIRQNNSHEMVVQEVPVRITVGKGLAVLKQSTDVVKIYFRGSSEDLRYISRDQVSLTLNITDRSSLRQTLKFSGQDVNVPTRASAVQFEPATVTVTMDHSTSRSLPVKAVLEGTFPDGIRKEQTVCDPAVVEVHGAESQLRDLELVLTDPINIDGRRQSFETQMNVASEGKSWTVFPDRVAVKVILTEHVDERRLEGCLVRPLMLANDSRTVSIQPDRVNVVLKGPPQLIEALEVRDICSYVDCADMPEPTPYKKAVRVDLLPDGVHVEIEPSEVTVTTL
jgi:YbbR domain-containing protein